MKRENGGALRRFKTQAIDPGSVRPLAEDNAAVVEGRTLFPTRRAQPTDVPRLLVGGHNNAKIGAKVLKGAWSGMSVYTLTLEERATCPRCCAQWRTCYGSAMPFPRRLDAYHPEFMPLLAREVVDLAKKHPKGYVVRLHVLGDFFSVAYVRAWRYLIESVPALHVYGYTARHEEDPDPTSAAIAREITALRDEHYDRFAIRTSHVAPGRDRTMVVSEVVDLPGVIMCPAQERKEMTCGTCALCWAPNARDKTVAFLIHGVKHSTGPRKPSAPRRERGPRRTRVSAGSAAARKRQKRVLSVMARAQDGDHLVTMTMRDIAAESGTTPSTVQDALAALETAGAIEVAYLGHGNVASTYEIKIQPEDFHVESEDAPIPALRAEPVLVEPWLQRARARLAEHDRIIKN